MNKNKMKAILMRETVNITEENKPACLLSAGRQ